MWGADNLRGSERVAGRSNKLIKQRGERGLRRRKSLSRIERFAHGIAVKSRTSVGAVCVALLVLTQPKAVHVAICGCTSTVCSDHYHERLIPIHK